ncbi:helix-turn-helix domain-containing protein [Halotalea alkalilenta]|uniref:Transcriptional regulator n=1 Tax=Halotalea alkalilenta TaxID=376489 RepID=A0A172YFT2_9GAMM|nr:XRE family transcriptional regulator [Halotalea alkalilenta]ANF58128.1 transcriptional regulator [Halotalea alkalilenta]
MTDSLDQDAALRIAAGRKPFIEPLRLGERLKAFRLARQWTLEEVSQRTGLARSTLSKIENDQTSPTFAVVQKLANGLGLDLPQLLKRPGGVQRTAGRRDLTRRNEGKPHPTPTYEHELLSWQLAHKRMVPFKTIVHARSIDDFSDWVRHGGEEFLMVLEGSILLYSEFYEPLRLDAGDSLYFDSDMGHAKVSISEQDAVVLSVCTYIEDAL